MATDTRISQLIINKLTKAQYDEAKAAGNISDVELYFITDDTGITPDAIAAQPVITGNPGDFVVIGDDGSVTTKAIPSAEGVSF